MATQLEAKPAAKTRPMTTRRIATERAKPRATLAKAERKSLPKTVAKESKEAKETATSEGKGPKGAKAVARYDTFKEFEGRRYTGMKIGRSHKWYYDQGEWKEKKITPDEWQIQYAVTKRRVGKAPEGSGVPVGTGYHWLILAHQFVQKLNANDYSTEMTGLKFKIAHKRADRETWSASAAAQRKNLIKALKRVIEDLEREEASGVAAIPMTEATASKPN